MTKIINTQKAEELKTKLIKNGYKQFNQNNKYVLWSLKKDKTTVTYYSSKKLYVNNNESEILNLLNEDYQSKIGADESGKGDYFGPLVVCAAYVPKEEYTNLYKLNVRDSKTINDTVIDKIFSSNSFQYEVKILSPVIYNEQMKKVKNLNILLTNSYIEIITKLKNKVNCENIIIDAYETPAKIQNSFPFKVNATTKAEQKELSVALASVIARYFFVKELENMSEKYGAVFPKGSSNVIDFAKSFVEKYGEKELKNVAKLHFSLTNKILKN